MKLIESLIGEVAPLSPTQYQGQDKSVVLSGKGQEVNIADTKDAAKGQKNPKDSSEPSDPNDQQQGGGLLAMMVAVPSARTKPTLSLNFGRSAGEDSFVRSSKPTEASDPVYAPEVPVVLSQAAPVPQPAMTQQAVDPTQPSTQEPVEAPAPTPTSNPVSAIPVPAPIVNDTPARDRQSSGDRPRPKLDLSTDSRQAPALPLALGKVRAGGPPSTEPIAFAARLTQREVPEDSQSTKPAPVQRDSQKQLSLTQPAQPQGQEKADQENVPTNPKPNSPVPASQPSSEPAAPRTKPVVAEPAPENVPTNPKSPAAFSVPAGETPAHIQQTSTKSEPAPEVKGSAPMQETELQAKPTIRSEPAREISIRIPSPDNGNVDVQIVERDGKVQVTVRGSDTQLNSALRSELTDLVHTLDQKGYKTETWTPSETHPLTSASAPEVQTPGRRESSQEWSGNQPNDGGNGGNQGGNQQQRRQQQERPDWLIELERRLETEG